MQTGKATVHLRRLRSTPLYPTRLCSTRLCSALSATLGTMRVAAATKFLWQTVVQDDEPSRAPIQDPDTMRQ